MSEGTPALTHQLDMIEWLRTNPVALAWADWFMNSSPGMAKVNPGGQLRGAHGLPEAVAVSVNRSETVFISREMCDLIEHAASTMPDIPIQEDNLMWKKAFIFFERPIKLNTTVEDDPGPDVFTQAIQFEVTGKVGQAESYERAHGDVMMFDVPGVEYARGIYHTTFVPVTSTPYSYNELGSRLFPYDMSAWTFGKKWKTVPMGTETTSGLVDESLSEQRKLLLATNLIAQQHISVRTSQKGIRQQRRRVDRMDKPLPNFGNITYVTLRRARETSDSDLQRDGAFEYSHRFVVQGFWRHQWYPSKGEHHLIWIDPFIKGPADKPLIIKDKVYKLVR